jgi:hypothetical protein
LSIRGCLGVDCLSRETLRVHMGNAGEEAELADASVSFC